MADVENLVKGAKERLFAGTGVAVGRAPGPIDTESTGIVIKEPTFWEKARAAAIEHPAQPGPALTLPLNLTLTRPLSLTMTLTLTLRP